MAVLAHSLIGWGTYIFLLLIFVVFIIYSFHITDLIGFGKQEPSDGKSDPGDRRTTASFENELDLEKERLESEIALDEPNNLDGESSINQNSDNKLQEEIAKELRLDVEDSNQELSEESEAQDKIDDKTDKEFTDSDNVELVVDRAKGDEKVVEIAEHYDPTLDLGTYQYPTIDLLNEYPGRDAKVTREELEQNKEKIIETLVNFKIGISSIKATIGPTVTLYEIVPDAGVKISKIKNLEDDIALSLSALGIRIIAPIPGKGTIGIEVPNKNKQLVSVRSVLATDKFMKSDKELPIILGRTIANEVFVADLTKMPHLLIAGATGQGKSVGLNVILASLIYKKHPSQLKFILVDPKKVELTLYNKIERHFLAELPGSEEPIVTDTKRVIYTLNSLTIEMDTRYNLLKDAQCRNLREYNEKFMQRRLNPQKGHRYLPYIILVVDELADLMMTAGKEIETPIARLAQLARAIGIHLVIATQRPDVKVITGTIKVNFPVRISYKVVSKMDSRIILDTGGADQLVGMGDMLLSINSDIIRLQCPFIDTSEVDKICEFVGSQRGYPSAYLLPEYEGDESGELSEVDLGDRDALFDEAARLIVLHQQGSTSLIQRKLKLGYNRAGRLIDQLEAAGIVGPFEGSKAREVLVSDEYALEQLLKDLNENKN
jgi:S-DNA-T family DNA segregation ATPase FtsK/SpoIIIE